MDMIFFSLSFTFILGLISGSFLNVLIPRLRNQEKGIISGRSRCPKCHHQLHANDLIPLLSFFLLQGRCRYCRCRIPLRYPIIEFTTGLVFTFIVLKFLILENSPIISGIYLLYSLILLFTFFYDLFYLEISDLILLPAIALALIVSLFSHPLMPNLTNALLGAAIPLIFFTLQIIISRGQWLGGGDLRIGAFMGLILGWEKTIVAIILSYIIGSIIAIFFLLKKKAGLKTMIPFGPFLVSATFISILFGKSLIDWYIGLVMLM